MKYTYVIAFAILLILLGCTSLETDKLSKIVDKFPIKVTIEPTTNTETVSTETISDKINSELYPPESSKKVKKELIIVPPPIKIIDHVYALDLETYSKPEGRALVAGKIYEMIAEDNLPFDSFVKFTVYTDGIKLTSLEATCPEFCANEGMYSRLFTIPDGDYTEITVTAEDGNGTKGTSISYLYAKTSSQAMTIARSCPVDNVVPEYPTFSNPGKTLVSYGGTIAEGWSEGTSPVGYEVPTDYADICSYVKANSPSAGGYFAQTRVVYPFHYEYDVTPKQDPKSCTCNCVVKPKNLEIPIEISVDFPDWSSYGAGNTCQQGKWDDFSSDLKIHEEGHVSIYQSGVATIKSQIGEASATVDAVTCQQACDPAVTQLDEDVDQKYASALSDIEKEQENYDSTTDHGSTQGATLDCGAC
ncbi:MAG: DUF922 domain-containing protein [Candidatus Micrarchaeota archaeon]|nr:DUF922 domain-containing protein [Candidatus Micrarchaeota archaeon]